MAEDGSHDIIVIGGGVAAMSAAFFAAHVGLRVVVVSDIFIGGQILNVEEIVNYPGLAEPVSGPDLSATMELQAMRAGASFVYERATSILRDDDGFTVSCAGTELVAPTVIVATGSSSSRLGVPGELELAGCGVSYCGSCDGALFAGCRVAVIGGGDSAAEEALLVARYASAVTIVLRGEALQTTPGVEAKVLANENITLLPGSEPVAIIGDTTVTGLRVRHNATGEERDLEVAGVFVYVGLSPNTALLAALVDLDPTGRVPANEHMETIVPGLFVAGDIRLGFAGYLVNGASDGVTAAAAARRYLAARSANSSRAPRTSAAGAVRERQHGIDGAGLSARE